MILIARVGTQPPCICLNKQLYKMYTCIASFVLVLMLVKNITSSLIFQSTWLLVSISMMHVLTVAWCLLVLGVGVCQAIMFPLQPSTVKCLKEEIHKDVLVSGEYTVQEAIGQKVDLRVSYKYLIYN